MEASIPVCTRSIVSAERIGDHLVAITADGILINLAEFEPAKKEVEVQAVVATPSKKTKRKSGGRPKGSKNKSSKIEAAPAPKEVAVKQEEQSASPSQEAA